MHNGIEMLNWGSQGISPPAPTSNGMGATTVGVWGFVPIHINNVGTNK